MYVRGIAEVARVALLHDEVLPDPREIQIAECIRVLGTVGNNAKSVVRHERGPVADTGRVHPRKIRTGQQAMLLHSARHNEDPPRVIPAHAAPRGGEQEINFAVAVHVAYANGVEAEGVPGDAVSVGLEQTSVAPRV